jgi:hypothetical protein
MSELSTVDWLPNKIRLSDYSGDLNLYIEDLYKVFLSDFFDRPVFLCGKPVYVSSAKEDDGKLERFWHVITDPHSTYPGDIKFERSERLSWIRSVIENMESDQVLFYERFKNKESRVYLFLPGQRFIVVLSESKKAYYLVTAFYIEYSYKVQDYLREYKTFGPKTKTAP